MTEGNRKGEAEEGRTRKQENEMEDYSNRRRRK
jgi:hypothetical protein